MPRVSLADADRLLDQTVDVLDHGFVRLVDYMGGDERIVAAARVSYGKGTKSVREDAALIDYLMRHGHTSPFEQVILTIHAKMPIFVARQWVRHRTARLNEVSGRYSVLADEFYLPERTQIKPQSKRSKQGRAIAELPKETQDRVLALLQRDQQTVYDSYQEFLTADIARELARINLPLSTYTQWYWQIDLHNLFNFLLLRLDSHAQYEIRQYAEAIVPFVRAVAPIAWSAFEEHALYAKKLPKTLNERLRRFLEESAPAQSEASALLDELNRL